MSTLRVNNLQNTSTTDGGISINNSGHITMDGVPYPSAGPLSNRNLIINGAMQVAQRGTSESGLTDSPAYLVDRFSYRRQGSWGSNSFTMSQQSSGAPDGFTHFLRLAQSGTAAAPPTNTWCGLATLLEGNTIYQANFGTSAAQPLTVSFYARASQAGTYCFALQNGAADQSFVAENSVTTSWQRFTVNIPARTTGNWSTNNSIGFQMYWVVAADSDGVQSGSTGWTAETARYTTNQLETFASTSGATFDLCGVQLEVGSVATPFEHRSYGDELAKCQRYFVKIGASYNGFRGTSSTSLNLYVPTPVEMRTAGSVQNYSSTACRLYNSSAITHASSSLSVNTVRGAMVELNGTGFSGVSDNQVGWLYFTAELEAEL